jgi:hypothetical protein
MYIPRTMTPCDTVVLEYELLRAFLMRSSRQIHPAALNEDQLDQLPTPEQRLGVVFVTADTG